MSGGPKTWCELFLILYCTPYSTKLKVNKTDVVAICLFRIFTYEQIILIKPCHCCKTFGCFDSSRILMYCEKQRLIATNNCSGRFYTQ